MSTRSPSPAERLRALHERTDARFAATTAAIGSPIACRRGCAGCCQDGLTVWQIEADAIAALVRRRGLQVEVHPPGACAFVDAGGACQVYAIRPYVCRSQGAVLGWLEAGEGGARPRRDTCPEHGLPGDLACLPEAAVFEIGPAERELVEIATAALGVSGQRGLPRRVGLRALAVALSDPGEGARDRGP